MGHAETIGPAGETGPSRPAVDRLPAWVLGAGLLAGVVTWAVGEATVEAFRPKLVTVNTPGGRQTGASVQEWTRADVRNAALAFAVQGACLGLMLGLAGGLGRGSARAGASAGLAGAVLGGALALGASMALQPVYYGNIQPDRVEQGLGVPMLVHGGIWGVVGLAAGAAFGLGRGGPRSSIVRAAVGGLLGGLLAAVLFEPTAAMWFPEAKTTRPLPMTSGSRLLAKMLVALLSAAGIAALAASRTSGPVSVPAPPEPVAGPPPSA